MSEQDSGSDTMNNDNEDEEDSKPTEPHQIHNGLNNIMYHEDNSSEPEDESSEGENITDIETHTNNEEQNNIHENKLLYTNLEVKVENRKVEGLITYSTDEQIFKFKVISESNQEVWGVYIDFQSIHSKWTIDAILQYMGSYATTENPNNHLNILLSMKMNYILYLLHLMKFYIHYKTNTRSIFIFKINIHMILVEEILINVISRNILKSYMSILICFSMTTSQQIYIFHSSY